MGAAEVAATYYDALARRVSSTMPGDGKSTYAYDILGRVTSRHHPDAAGATLYKYDDLGRLRFSQDARQKAAGKVTYTVYDFAGRITRLVYPDGGQARYAYDGAGRLIRLWDAESGLDYMPVRSYDYNIGRFLRPEPF